MGFFLPGKKLFYDIEQIIYYVICSFRGLKILPKFTLARVKREGEGTMFLRELPIGYLITS